MNKKKKTGLIWVIILAIIIFFVFRKQIFPPHHFKKYKEFGIYLPTKYNVHGIDVSHHQGEIDWKLVSDMLVDSINIDFAFIKATEGKSHVDSEFKQNWSETKKVGITRGAYHYFKPKVDGVTQALHFYNQVKLEKGDLPPVIDIEETGGCTSNQLVSNLKKMMKQLETTYEVKPILYTFHDFYDQHFKGIFDDYPLWIAHYYVLKPESNMWNFWQLHDKSKVSGINTPVDFNVFNKDLESFKRLLIK